MDDFQRAMDHLAKGQLRQGKEILERLLEQNPREKQLLYNLGIVCSELGELDRSASLLEEALVTDPLDANVYAALGFTYYKLGKNQKAREKLEYAIKAQPNNFYALKNLAGILGNAGEYEEALQLFERADKIHPHVPEILFGKAMSLVELQRADEAITLLKEVIHDPKSPDPLQTRAKEEMNKITRMQYEKDSSEYPRMDVVMYCLGALERFQGMDHDEVKKITFEIARLGMQGLDIHDPTQKYHLDSLEGNFSGMHLLSYEYVGFKQVDPSLDIGIDLAAEYQQALQLFQMKKPSRSSPKPRKTYPVDLLPEVLKVLEEIEERTGKEVEIILKDSMPVNSVTRIGFSVREKHQIVLSKAVARNANHLVLHGCGNILRFFDADPEDQKVVGFNLETDKITQARVEAEATAAGIPVVPDVIQMWSNSVIQQLTSQAEDFRIERWIYETFPFAREEQQFNLSQDAEIAVQTLAERIRKTTPPSIFTASNALNYAHISLITPFIGRKHIKQYYDYPRITAIGKSLLEEVPENDQGRKGDIQLIDAWAEMLGLDGWFVWMDMKDH